MCNKTRLSKLEFLTIAVSPHRLKGVSISFIMLKNTLCGNYLNFGVFQLYGDRALEDALNMFVQIVVSVPHNSLLVSLPHPLMIM